MILIELIINKTYEQYSSLIHKKNDLFLSRKKHLRHHTSSTSTSAGFNG